MASSDKLLQDAHDWFMQDQSLFDGLLTHPNCEKPKAPILSPPVPVPTLSQTETEMPDEMFANPETVFSTGQVQFESWLWEGAFFQVIERVQLTAILVARAHCERAK